MSDLPRDRVYVEIEAERLRQEAKWGEQNHPDGTGDVCHQAEAHYRRTRADAAAQAGTLTWKDIALEEVWEALAERDPSKLRAELIQALAVGVAWVEAIDRRPVAHLSRLAA